MKKKLLKKLLSILLSAIMIFALAACGGTGTNNDGNGGSEIDRPAGGRRHLR